MIPMLLQVSFALAIAAMIVAGQSLWKIGMTGVLNRGSTNIFMAVATNISIIVGVIIYGIATLLYMYAITKFKYGTTYALIVSFSLLAATSISSIYFHERLLRINLLGIILILAGVVLVVRK